MANINVVCIGKLKEKYFKEAEAEYLKRLSAFCRVSVIEKKESALLKETSDTLIQKAVEEESASILECSKGTLIALSPDGESMGSEKFAAVINKSIQSGDITFAIGGSYGLSRSLKQKAAHIISFSDMTFPHQLFRVILLEQVYRAFMITEGRTYHK